MTLKVREALRSSAIVSVTVVVEGPAAYAATPGKGSVERKTRDTDKTPMPQIGKAAKARPQTLSVRFGSPLLGCGGRVGVFWRSLQSAVPVDMLAKRPPCVSSKLITAIGSSE